MSKPADANLVAKNLEQSLTSTRDGLALFLQSLQGAELQKALPGYQQLQRVLWLQLGWAQREQREELYPFFEEIAKIAGQAHSLLNPYAVIMRHLSLLSGAEAADATAKILALLAQEGRMSLRKLVNSLQRERQELQRDLDSLTEKGVLARQGRGGGLSYQLSSGFTEVMTVSALQMWAMEK